MIELIESYEETKSRYELKHEHGPHGGYVLKDDEFKAYKGWLQTIAAAAEFEAAFPEMAKGLKYTTSEFTRLYAEREEIVQALSKYKPDQLVHQMSEPEIKEFFEYLHAGIEMGAESELAHLAQLGTENYGLFEKFVKMLSENPHAFDKVTAIAEHLPYIH